MYSASSPVILFLFFPILKPKDQFQFLFWMIVAEMSNSTPLFSMLAKFTLVDSIPVLNAMVKGYNRPFVVFL